jgi:hypothetical protein
MHLIDFPKVSEAWKVYVEGVNENDTPININQIQRKCWTHSVCFDLIPDCVRLLFVFVLGGALEPVSIDLLAALNLHNTSQHEGVSITEGYRNQRIATINKIAYHLQGKL